ncbi:MAG: hypothetical protein HS108_09620 [Planctomycetes bacterium]|jgi:hypothetical protein|nr:hypothetical protein [Planctomycetota bacterium]
MFLDPSGDTLFFHRRADGLDTLFVMQPDGRSADRPLALYGSREPLRAWAAPGGALCVASPWPSAPGGLKLRVYDMARVRALLARATGDINAGLTDVPEVGDFSPEPRPLPEPVFARLRGDTLAVPGQWQGRPALYVLDGRAAASRVVPLEFLDAHSLPAAVVDEPGTARRWLTVADSHHLFVLEGPEFALAGDLVWAPEQRGLARVAFHPAAPEAWVSAGSSVLVVDRAGLRVLAEIPVEPAARWHRGRRIAVTAGAVVFSPDGRTAWVARPYSGDVLELDARARRVRQAVALSVDPLELVTGPGRVYAQGLRNGSVTWWPTQA